VPWRWRAADLLRTEAAPQRSSRGALCAVLLDGAARTDAPAQGLAAGVGADDLPPSCAAWLAAAGVDCSGLLRLAGTPTPRAWQVLERDGRRTQARPARTHSRAGGNSSEARAMHEAALASLCAAAARPGSRLTAPAQVWRTPHEPVTLRPSLSSLPVSFRAASAFHLGVHPLLVDLQHLAQLRAAAEASPTLAPRGKLLSIEPYTSAERLLTDNELQAFCSAAHVVSPNEAEAISMVGPAPPAELVARLADAGAAVVALRRGPEGAIVHCAATGETWDVPTVAGVAAVDPTGCGNAFCGGFLASWRAGESLLDAGVWVRPARLQYRAALTPRVRQGCVAASFMVRIGAGKSSGSVIC